jgi:putative ABC transport system permease protein
MTLGLDIAESARIAWSAIIANKGRGALTTLGIIIGIVAVITTMTAANGLANSFRQSFSAVGSDVVYVSRMPWVIVGDFFLYRNRPAVSLQEADELAENLRGRAVVNPSIDTNRPVRYRETTVESANVIGTTEKQIIVSSAVPETGRFLMSFDLQYRRPVCVIGHEIWERLFGEADPLNEEIRVGRHSCRVIGVMEKQGSSFFGGPNFDLQIFIPVSTFEKNFGGRTSGRDVNIAVKAPSQEAIAELEYEIIGEMRKVRGLRPGEEDNFSINKLDTLVDAYNNVMGVVLLVGLLVTGISLFVGGVGVMNIMFVSVTERTREIGIRKAIGAKRRSILMQFIFEAGAICLFGGLAGILLAWLVTLLIDATLMPASMSLPIVIMALLISLIVGVLAGIVPAFKGARQDPIEALRYE